MASSDLKEYVVTLHRHEDLDSFYEDMETPGGNLYIPSRAVDVFHRREISRNTHYLLTEEEVVQLRKDPRVRAVNLSIKELEKDGPIIDLNWTQTGDFAKAIRGTETSSDKNWALLRSTAGPIANWNSLPANRTINRTISYPLEGLNVDIVIVDGAIQYHPEFTINPNGTGSSRLQRINWFDFNSTPPLTLITNVPPYDYDYPHRTEAEKQSNNDHGTHVAGIAAGNTQGWARKSNIYNIGFNYPNLRLDFLFDYIRAFHSSKPINPATGRKNPTVCNNSWGGQSRFPISSLNSAFPGGKVIYKGTTYNPPFDKTGLGPGKPTWVQLGYWGEAYLDSEFNEYTLYVPIDLGDSFRADIEDAIQDGIHIVWAGGNTYNRTEKGNVGENIDTVLETYGGTKQSYFNRHSVLGTKTGLLEQVINVGCISMAEGVAVFSTKGPAIDVWAPGDGIVSSTFYQNETYDSRGGAIIAKSGTSMAAPQVTGALACLLELHPTLTPAQAKQFLLSKSSPGQVYQPIGIGNNYNETGSLQGAPNLFLFTPSPTFNVTANKASASPGQEIRFTINTTNVPDGSLIYVKADGTATSDFSDVTNSAVLTVNSNTATWVKNVSSSKTGTTNFTVKVYTGQLNGTLQTTSSTISLVGAGGSPPTYAFRTPVLSVNEGVSQTYTIDTTNVPDGTTLYWAIKYNTAISNDFTGDTQGPTTWDTWSASYGIPASEGIYISQQLYETNNLLGNYGSPLAPYYGAFRKPDTGGVVFWHSEWIKNGKDIEKIKQAFALSIPAGDVDYSRVRTNAKSFLGVANNSVFYDGTPNPITIQSNIGSFSVNIKQDNITENAENFQIEILSGLSSTSNTPVLTSPPITINAQTVGSPTYTFSSYPTIVGENSSENFTITTTNVVNNTRLYWTIDFNGSSSSADFTTTSGSFLINNGTGTFSVSIVQDLLSESENFIVQVRTTSTNGTLVAQTPAILIQDIVTPGLPATYRFSSAPSSINEGSSGRFDVETSNVPSGTTLYWVVNHGSTSSADFTTSNGSFTITNNSGTFQVPIKADVATEGSETFSIQIKTDSITGDTVLQSSDVTINDTSLSASSYTFTSVPSSVNEGSSANFNVATTNVADGTTLYWTIGHISTSSGDFTSTNGSFTITNNIGSFAIPTAADSTTEGPQTFTARIRIGGTSGTIVATSSIVTLNDTSLSPTYAFTTAPISINEGASGTFRIATTNVPSGTTLYWAIDYNSPVTSVASTLTQTSSSDSSDFVATNGSFVINNNVGEFVVSLVADSTTEGSKTFRVLVLTQNNDILATSSTITINDVSVAPYILTTNTSSVSEGSSVTINVFTSNLPNGTLLPYTISGTGITTNDFVGLPALSGFFRITNNFGSIVLTLKNDATTELTESFTLTLTSTGNNENITVTILDTSKTTTLVNFSVTSPVSIVEEGQVARFDVKATNLSAGAVVPYRILGISADDLTGGAQLTGFLTFAAGAVAGETYANVTLPIYEDFITEGQESIVLLLEPDFPYVLELSSSITIKDTAVDRSPTYNITSDKVRVIEGSNVKFTLVVTNVNASDIIPWEVKAFTPQVSDITVGDFAGLTELKGVFPALAQISTNRFISNLVLDIRDDLVFEPSEYFYLSIPEIGATSPIIEVIDSGNTLVITDEVFTGNISIDILEPAVLKANLGSLASGKSSWEDTTGLLSENMVIQGKTFYATGESLAFYHPFSYVVRSKVSIEEWRDSVKTLLHPAGMTIFSEINNESTAKGLEVKAVSDSVIISQGPLTVDSTIINASTISIDTGNVTVDSLTF